MPFLVIKTNKYFNMLFICEMLIFSPYQKTKRRGASLHYCYDQSILNYLNFETFFIAYLRVNLKKRVWQRHWFWCVITIFYTYLYWVKIILHISPDPEGTCLEPADAGCPRSHVLAAVGPRVGQALCLSSLHSEDTWVSGQAWSLISAPFFI